MPHLSLALLLVAGTTNLEFTDITIDWTAKSSRVNSRAGGKVLTVRTTDRRKLDVCVLTATTFGFGAGVRYGPGSLELTGKTVYGFSLEGQDERAKRFDQCVEAVSTGNNQLLKALVISTLQLGSAREPLREPVKSAAKPAAKPAPTSGSADVGKSPQRIGEAIPVKVRIPGKRVAPVSPDDAIAARALAAVRTEERTQHEIDDLTKFALVEDTKPELDDPSKALPRVEPRIEPRVEPRVLVVREEIIETWTQDLD